MKLTSNKTTGAKRNGFTLLELVVVLCILAILAALVLPALAATKPGSSVAQCLNDKRQLSIAWQMYASDNSDSLMGTAWVGGTLDWRGTSADTNAALLTDPSQSLIAAYIHNAAVFKCPADNYQSAAMPGPRVRSVSCNLALMGAISVQGLAPGNGTYISAKKIIDLAKPGPAGIFLFLDEHPDSINDGQFALNPGYAKTGEHWRDLPASYHNGAAGISFADGHCEMHTWMAVQTSPVIFPVLMINYPSSAPWAVIAYRNNVNYEWMEARMPYH
jgi:prepilin-type N-terminal cleavage/methylation domain-containing protein/prepilin-type processing-associated H-X9-DG protein